jgi:hypothetical protein
MIFLDFFNKENIVLFFLATGAPGGTVGDDGEDVEHAKENTETGTKDKGDGSTLPFSKNRDGNQKALSEGSPVQETEGSMGVRAVVRVVRAVMMVLVMFMVVVIGRLTMRAGMREVRSFLIDFTASRHALNHSLRGTDEWKDTHFRFLNLLVLVRMIHFNTGQSKRLPEGVGEL